MAQHNAMTPPGEDPRRTGRGLGLATRVQVAAHSFMSRRADLGLTRRRVRMESDPGRRESMAIIGSITLTAVICLAALFWSFLRPAGSAGQASIIADQKTGALYVRVGQTLYPALNLASARLIAGQADNPVRVRRSEIDGMARGPLVGIPGAPSMLDATSPTTSSWLVCDAVTKTFGVNAPEPVAVTVIDGQPELSERRRTLQPNDALLLRYDNSVWLIREGRRSRVDPAQRPVLLALGVSDSALAAARTMSQALFDAIPVGPSLTVPVIPGAGTPAGFPGAPGPVGTVVSTPQVGGQTTYSVVLPAGMQEVTPIVAQIVENANRAGAAVPVVAGPQLAALPAVTTLDVSGYPDAPLNIVDNQENPATCWWWKKADGEDRASIDIISGASIPIPEDQADKAVELVNAERSPAQANKVFFGPDYANYVITTGNDETASSQETLWWVSDSGARFGVPRDEETLRALGFSTPPKPAPWSVLRLLAPAPALTNAGALVRPDTLPANAGGKLEQPK